jgi:signal transduction histidine kinase
MDNARLLDQRMQEERLAAVGSAVASLSHSIKNILQGMRGGSDVVELGLRKNSMDVMVKGWDIVRRNQEKIYQLTLNMLQFSKQRQPELSMEHLLPMFKDLAGLVQSQFDAKGVALITDVEPDLPPVPIELSGIHQAVLNLLQNALDACEPDTGVVTLACRFDELDQEVRIIVRDNGIGMSRATQRELFQPFRSTKGYGGTGLGLVVTRKIVQEHGGEIAVQSKLKQGTTFTISLPTEYDREPAATHSPF